MKIKLISGFLLGVFVLSSAGLVLAQALSPSGGGGVLTPGIWTLSGTNILPTNSTWHLGSSSARIAKGWFTDLDASAVTLGGAVSGNMVVSGYTSTTRILTATGTTALPSHTFTDEPDTGMHLPASGRIGFSVDGTRAFTMSSTNTLYGSTDQVSLSLDAADASRLKYSNNSIVVFGGTIDLYVSGVNQYRFDTSMFTSTLPLTVSAGSSTFSASVSTTRLVVSTNAVLNGAVLSAPNLSALGATGDLVCQNNTTGLLEVQITNCTVSSIRFKEHVRSLNGKELMKRVRALRPVSFDWKNGDRSTLGTSQDEGFIAEEVATIDPYLVAWKEGTNEDIRKVLSAYPSFKFLEVGGRKFVPQTVDYAKVSMLVTGAVQDLDERVSRLEKYGNSE